MTTLIIARHGNTFNKGDTPTRVGARTDLPLVDSGKEQAQRINQWLRDNHIKPDVAYCSNLQRTKQTTQIALGLSEGITEDPMFNEIDYGPDENQTEDIVIARIGEDAIKQWDQSAIVPNGWEFDPKSCIKNWKNFANNIIQQGRDTTFVCTSNGIARFAPYLTGDFDGFSSQHSIKLSTGAIGILKYQNNQWIVTDWNIKP